jgi:hypothetical protein
MAWVGVVAGAALIVGVFIDAFEVVILPRRVRRTYRLARVYYRSAWVVWRAVGQLLPPRRWRQGFLSIFGPFSLFGLLGLWAAGLITGFGLLHWSLGTALLLPPGADHSFATYLYFSGTTFFTLGYVPPASATGHVLSVVEAGVGFGFLAVVISYLPVVYQAFSRREITISLLDARAGSPPSAGELLRRMAAGGGLGGTAQLLAEWERWAAELLESHLSFPVLSFYRSQHDNQSWVGGMTTILDTCALLIAAGEGPDGYQARLTFAMARHAAVDLGLVFQTPPRHATTERLSATEFAQLGESLGAAGLPMRTGAAAVKALGELRELYEPFVVALAAYFELTVPPFQPEKPPVDNWQTSAWTKRSPGLGGLPAASSADDHFN